MKNKIFRQVFVADRLPKNEGSYIVGYEHGSFQCAYNTHYSFHAEFTDCSMIEWWLEEICLPTEDSVHKESVKYYGNSPGERSLNIFIFKHGAKFILNKIKGG